MGLRTIRSRGVSGIVNVFIFFGFSVLALAADRDVLQQLPLTADTMVQWRLPGRLNEISGLAMTPDGRLLAVTDEVGIVYELDYENGELVKAFAFGNPAVKDDFEGIAVADGLVYLVTSTGTIYLAAEGADGQRVTFDSFETGLNSECEFEGLAQSLDNSRLLLLCKEVKGIAKIDGLSIFVWSIEDREILRTETILLPEYDILKKLKVDRISPSGLTIDRQSGHLIIVASRQQALIEIDVDARLVEARHLLLTHRHRQAEGIELASGGRLVIADEGGSHKARLAVYHQEGVNPQVSEQAR